MLTLPDAAKLLSVSLSTVRREVADGRLRVSKIRGCIRIAPEDLEQYCRESRQCQCANMGEGGKPAFSIPDDDLARLLGIGATLRSGKRARAGGSTIVKLDERRATRSRKRSPAG
jgi:excisionase family DNA binding protein